MRGRGDLGLVAGDRLREMHAVVASVANREHGVFGGLPLHVEGPVFRVGQLVARIVATEQEGRRSVDQAILVWHESDHTGQILRRRRGRRVAERIRESGIADIRHGQGKGWLEGYAEGDH